MERKLVNAQLLSRSAALLLAFSLVGIAVAFWPHSILGVDAARLPKEGLFFAAAVVLLCLLLQSPDRRLQPVEWCMVAFVMISTASALQATNTAQAQRAIVITVASCIFFIGSRAVEIEHQRMAVAGVATAGMAVALSVLLEAGGVITRLSLERHGFGGTFLHRNHASHFMVCVLPATFWLALSNGRSARWWGVCGGALIASAVVVSRTRAAWLAFAGIAAVIYVAAASNRTQASETTWGKVQNRRLLTWLVALLVGIIGGAQLTNRISWTVSDPLRQTVVTLFDARSGSGLGRLLQYRNTSVMIADHWITGVGPGNWAGNYPAYADSSDPSLLTGIKRTDDLPLSDWFGIASERGIPALLALFSLFGYLVYAARKTESRSDQALLGTVAGTLILGSLDAVILNAAPSAVLFAQFGLYARRDSSLYEKPGWAGRRSVCVALLGLTVWLVPTQWNLIRSNAAITRNASEKALRRAAVLHPANYQAQVWLAMRLVMDGRCKEAMPHLERAIELQPFAHVARDMASNCRWSVSGERREPGPSR